MDNARPELAMCVRILARRRTAALKQSSTSLRRSIVFLAVTGEEKGLLGSRYFAKFPTVDSRKIVADINTDMFLPLFPFKKLTIFGIDESELGADAIAVAKASGIEPQADPEPKRNRFIRSDRVCMASSGRRVPSRRWRSSWVSIRELRKSSS